MMRYVKKAAMWCLAFPIAVVTLALMLCATALINWTDGE